VGHADRGAVGEQVTVVGVDGGANPAVARYVDVDGALTWE